MRIYGRIRRGSSHTSATTPSRQAVFPNGTQSVPVRVHRHVFITRQTIRVSPPRLNGRRTRYHCKVMALLQSATPLLPPPSEHFGMHPSVMACIFCTARTINELLKLIALRTEGELSPHININSLPLSTSCRIVVVVVAVIC